MNWRLPTIILALLVALATMSGCQATRIRRPVPEDLEGKVTVLGTAVIRTWADSVSEDYVRSMVDSVRQERRYYESQPQLTMPKTVDILTLSGGGEDGAFGAGLLCGWTEHGDRPQFKLVTGVSTGALIAPWAFLGPDYDDTLRKNYTKVDKSDIFVVRGFLSLFGSDGIADTSPLRRLVDQLVTDDVLRAIAQEHLKGRRLLIATSNLDAQRPVIWDMGTIACSNDPRARALFREVLVASASIPVAFPPVYISVQADGKTYDEMHVDGCAFAQVYLWGGGFSAALAGERLGDESLRRKIRLFVIRNSMVSPGYKQVTPKLFSIAGRAVATLIMANGLNDLFRLYTIATREGMDFNLAYIPPKATGDVTLEEPFDTKYMNRLFDYAYQRSKAGYPWLKVPPLVTDVPSSQPTGETLKHREAATNP